MQYFSNTDKSRILCILHVTQLEDEQMSRGRFKKEARFASVQLSIGVAVGLTVAMLIAVLIATFG